MEQIYQIAPSRAYLSYHYLTKFDCVDNKILFYDLHRFNSFNLTNSSIQISLNTTSSKTELLRTIILLEILTHQRAFVKSLNQLNFLKFYDMRITIQKNKLAEFLDLLLPTIFSNLIQSSMVLIINSIDIEQKFHIFSSTKFAEQFNSSVNYLIRVQNYLNQEKNVNFLPQY